MTMKIALYFFFFTSTFLKVFLADECGDPNSPEEMEQQRRMKEKFAEDTENENEKKFFPAWIKILKEDGVIDENDILDVEKFKEWDSKLIFNKKDELMDAADVCAENQEKRDPHQFLPCYEDAIHRICNITTDD